MLYARDHRRYRQAGPDHHGAPPPLASVIDLFCGAGALTHGFVREGFPVACGFDIDEACRHAFEQNNEAPFLRQDVSDLAPEDLAREFLPGCHRVLIGCAPCQPFSTYTQGRPDDIDRKWMLLPHFSRLIEGVLPDVVSMENVPRLVRYRNGELFDRFVSTLEACGYSVQWTIAECADYGAPQLRSRLVLMASRHGEPPMPVPTHDRSAYVTVKDAIGDMSPLGAGETDFDDPLHRASRLSERNMRRIGESVPGGTWRDWAEGLVADCHKRETGLGYHNVYGRMRWDRPAPTITTQFYGFGNGRFGHPEQDRALSLREGAVLQGFPSNYSFFPPGGAVSTKALGQMIGNAVPVTLARAIARAVASHLEDMS